MKLLLLVCIIALAEGLRHPTLWSLEKPCRSEKKCRNCEGRCVEEETVQCLRDPCEDSPCGDKEMCVANSCGECSACCLKPKKCNKRSKTCKDGSEIFRDPFNNCKYPKCPVPACAPKDTTTFFNPKT
eukprot:TRINITY_DN165_c0_g1_i3.p2 TRINITY_DN165_c0_g1~~TRINITY_DN165_c0_g1_i3.p2  ORF type:complete len:142 (+),score=48.74 TRINITY_DN165_c0_g1_i3:44-427(+)